MWIVMKEILKIMLLFCGEFIGICFVIALFENYKNNKD